MDTLKIQQRLNQIFQNKLKEDGISGPNTITQIKVFQKMEGLKDDGIVGPLTLKKLFPVNQNQNNIPMSEVKNSYPEFPEINYIKTSVEMGEIILYLKSLEISKEIKTACYVIFRNESGNGKSGINNNYTGIQADVSRWPDKLNGQVNGTVVKNERMTGAARRFLAFRTYRGNIDFLVDRIEARGLYVGGNLNVIAHMKINDVNDWMNGYWKSWVTGNAEAVPPADEKISLTSMYKQGEQIF